MALFKLKEDEVAKYQYLFHDFLYFQNFIDYVFRDFLPEIWIDSYEEPQYALLYSRPAYFIKGIPTPSTYQQMLSKLTKGSWIIPSSTDWKPYMMDYFKETMDVHKRVLFSSEALNVSKIKEMKGELPANLKIVKIEEKHLKEGLIYDDVVSRFFTVSRFKENGFGFALTDEFETVQGFCLTNYPFKGHEIELYFRIGYDHFQDFRHKGFGIQLCSYLIEFCLEHDFDPVWDSANDTSSHIAKKLGYTEREVWYAFHVL